MRAIVRQLGFQEGFVYYDRKAREAGESKYPLTKMLSFSIDGITSFSVALRFITFVGLLMTFGVFYHDYLCADRTFPGQDDIKFMVIK